MKRIALLFALSLTACGSDSIPTPVNSAVAAAEPELVYVFESVIEIVWDDQFNFWQALIEATDKTSS